MNIGEASRRTGLSARAIRHYEASGLIGAPARSGAGYRHFSEDDIRTLRFVRGARTLGFDLEAIGRLVVLWRAGPAAGADIEAMLFARVQELEKQEEMLRANRHALEFMRAHAARRPDPGCSLGALLSGDDLRCPGDAAGDADDEDDEEPCTADGLR